MSTFYKLSIREVKRETPQAISVTFNVPLEFQDFYKFTAGQYVNLKLSLDGQELRRAYSICSSPSSGELKITIKAVKNGTFSKFANEQLKEGNVIEVGLPEGRFTFEPQADRQRNYMAFSAGSGITPVMSILQTVLLQEPKSSFVLVYGNKTADETIYHHQLAELQKQFLGRLTVHYVFSQANVEGQLFGRIDKSVVNFVHNKHIGQEFGKYFLCGPEEMINTVNATLKEKGVAEKDIKFELFSAAPTTEKAITNGTFEHTKITVVLDNDEETFEMSTKQTLLEAALKQGMDAPYSCQGGICSSCIAKVTSGSAMMKKNSILTDKEVASGLILTCQAHPTSAEITVDYDDV
ncbi:2Fe-2S iron-sulfur cluster-binding protein [Flavobacterium sp. H122]|uniref:2Fe-2S iron-sulfur cluster-binding protein n=1 Tax=Flavobacterium sp. H122 TaxID=2529860 RepID=UPI0010A9E966|nr:2Fe-2S iron-sulfur cluster-binding protein [Flavobacterium sp. H122]